MCNPTIFLDWLHSEETVAQAIRANMTLEAVNVIKDENWKGGALLLLDDMMGRPSATVLARNRMWLEPIVQHCPKKVRGSNVFVLHVTIFHLD